MSVMLVMAYHQMRKEKQKVLGPLALFSVKFYLC